MKKKYYVFGIAAILVAVCLGLFMNRILNKNETSHEDEKNIGEEVLETRRKNMRNQMRWIMRISIPLLRIKRKSRF